MKKYRIYREGNYITVVNDTTQENFNGLCKEVFVDKDNKITELYQIFNISGFTDNTLITEQILKSDGSAYSKAEWETFYTENTGNFNGGGAAPETTDNKVSVYTVDGTGNKYYSSDYVNELADTKLDKTSIQNENYVYLSHEFLTNTNSEDFAIVVVNSGIFFAGTPTINNAGVHRFVSSTTANSGVSIRGHSLLVRLKGNEVFTYIFNPLTFTNTTSRFGIHDSTSSALPTNGVYFEYANNGDLKIVTEDNNVITSNTLSTLTANTWYKVKFTVNSNATSVLAELFNASGVLISSVTQTTNIPNTTRALNICAITTNSGTTATALIDVDFIGTKLTLTR